MINNKLVTIIKENQFDKGWTLFHPYDMQVNVNKNYQRIIIFNIVNLITYSDVVNLILSEPCLSSSILNEIKWVNKYINLKIIAKSEDIIKRYKELYFTNEIIDENVDFNYIGIIGKQCGYFMISDGYTEIDNSIDLVYFQNKKLNSDYTFLKQALKVIIIDEKGENDYLKLIDETNKLKLECLYVVNSKFYNKQIYSNIKILNIPLLISDFTKNAVIVLDKDFTLSCCVLTKIGFWINYQIENISAFLGKSYICGFYEDMIDTNMLVGEVFSCYNGVNKKLNIVDKKVIKIDANIPLMSEFISESFDKSVVDRHNDYSAEACKIEYQFTLIPPMIDDSYLESSLYGELHLLIQKWTECQHLDVLNIKQKYNECLDKDFGLISTLVVGQNFTNILHKKEDECDYINYYFIVKKVHSCFKNTKDYIIDICKNMFNFINVGNSESKFDKFDEEIAGYRQTIDEKNKLIDAGVDVLSNKRRVEILNKKINVLLKLKENFEKDSLTRNSNRTNQFAIKCNDLIAGKKMSTTDDSIKNVLQSNELNKLSLLESFVEKHLFNINNYLKQCTDILEKLLNVHIPEKYAVKEKNGERFIAIDNLDEIETTKELCKEFNLKCIARR